MRQQGILFIAIAANMVASYMAYVAAPAEQGMGDLYRILFIHVPVAWIGYLAFTISVIASILFLTTRNIAFDTTAEVSAILGLVYGVAALISGSIWANATWGTYWNWDPRETTTLILWIAYLGYISIKHSIFSPEKKAVSGAIYNILAFSTVPLSYFSIQLVPTLHPQIVTFSGFSMNASMVAALLLNIVAASILFIYLLTTISRIWQLERRIDELLYDNEPEGGA